MTHIVIKNDVAAGIFQSMLEGMWEISRDDNLFDRLKTQEALIEVIGGALPEDVTFPVSIALPRDLIGMASSVLENCLDNRENFECHDDGETPDEDRTFLHDGEIEIKLDVPMGCADAIEAAIEALETAHCVEGLPDDIEEAVRVLEMILQQRGCIDNSVGPRDDKLTSVMDVVIFG